MIEVSLVIPCFNESRGLQALHNRCLETVAKNKNLEILLVDNGSIDDSADVFAELANKTNERIKFVRVELNQGYGFGILEGLRQASGNYIGWTHADLQTDPMDVFQAIAIIAKAKKDVFIKGRRFGRPITDVIFTVGMSIYETLLLKTPLWDINAQPNLFPKSFFHDWQNPPKDFSLDLFAYYMAKKKGLRISRYPVRFGKRQFGVSSWNVDWKSKRKFIDRTISFSRELAGRL